MQVFTKTLMRQLITMFVIGSLVPLAIITLQSVNFSREALDEVALEKLEAIRIVKSDQLRKYIKKSIDDMEILAHSGGIHKAFGLLEEYHDQGGGSAEGNYNVEARRYNEIYDEIDPFFRRYVETYGYYDMFFICAAHGHVMYTVSQESDLGENLSLGKYRDSGLGRLWEKVVRSGKSSMVDFSPYAPSNNAPAAFIGTPVLDEQGKTYAVLALQVPAQQISEIVQEQGGIGESGEIYLVGEDFLMRSDLKKAEVSTLLNSEYKVETEAARRGANDEAGTDIIENFRGTRVLSAFSHLELDETFGFDFEWTIIAEIAEEEALASVKTLTKRIVTASVILVLCACLLGYFLSRSISRPLTELAQKISRVADGDLAVEIVDNKRQNEMGILVRAAGQMVDALREQTTTLSNSSSAIGASISQLSATASQLAASSNESSTTIAEVTSTAEEVRHTAHLSNEKAEDVTNLSMEMQSAAEKGHNCTVDTINGMQTIKEEMNYVAESIVKLSEQTLSIGEIISAVNDLSDQSNLLSVNAAIEAAKAGEYGKGFAVVAQKIMTLAEQSKEATGQVKTILNDIQKATSNAVLATERGSKAVEDGERLSESAGDAISVLANQVESSSQAAGQIYASNQQQLEGMDQLAAAMENIKEAALQNSDGANQLKDATLSLDRLGQELKQVAGRFNV